MLNATLANTVDITTHQPYRHVSSHDHANRHSLSMQEGAIAGGSLNGVAESVTQVEGGPHSSLFLISSNHLSLMVAAAAAAVAAAAVTITEMQPATWITGWQR
jgi:hypothetical protein